MGSVIEPVMEYVYSNPGCLYKTIMAEIPNIRKQNISKALTILTRSKYIRRELVPDPRGHNRQVYSYYGVRE